MAEATEVANTETTTTEGTGAPATTPATPGPGESLLGKVASTSPPTLSETPDDKTDPSDKDNYLLNYKTKEEAEKAIKGLRTKLAERQGPGAPEAYDFTELKADGVGFADEEHETQVVGMLKEAGVPQSMLAKLAPISKDLSERAFNAGQAAVWDQVVKHYGEPLDGAEQIAILKKEFGDNYASEMQAIAKFKETLPPDLFRVPLDRSAAGLQFLREYQKQVRGADFIRDSDSTSSTDVMRKAEILSDPAYREPGAKGEALRAEILRINGRLTGESR